MSIQRIDHIGINVVDLAAAKAFFLEMGFTIVGEMEMKGGLVEKVTGLKHVTDTMVMLGAPGGDAMIELVQYHTPLDEKGIQPNASNTLGIRHICIAVNDIDNLVATLQKRGATFVGEMQNYQNIYKLCYIRGPEGIILELAEKLV